MLVQPLITAPGKLHLAVPEVFNINLARYFYNLIDNQSTFCMRTLLVGLFLLLSLTGIRAQSFYEIEWEADLQYTALITYYDEEQIEVRVKYIDADSVYRVAKYLAEGTVEIDEDGETFFIFDGHDATVIYSSDDSPAQYVADNFIFMTLNDDYVFEDLFTIDDAGLEEDDLENYMVSAEYRLLDPSVDFNEQFIYNYFEPHEPEYSRYLGLVIPVESPQQPVTNPEPTTEQPARPVMHLVMVADVEDRSIGKSTAQDQRDITSTFTKISRELGIEIRDYQFSGQTFNKNQIISGFNSINSNPNDIIIYYYSGHGYNDTEKTSTFPTMALDGPDLGLEELYHEIKGKSARLTMIIGDMCNSLPENRSPVGKRESIPFKSGYLFDANKLNKLFIQSSGILISTSSQKGEWSFCMNNPDGTMGNGQFTHAFIESMIKEASKVSASDAEWDDLFNRAYLKAHESTIGITNQNGKKGQSGFNVLSINY